MWLGDQLLFEPVDGTRQSGQHAKGVLLQHVLLPEADVWWSPVGAPMDQASRPVLVRFHPCSGSPRHALVPRCESNDCLLFNFLAVVHLVRVAYWLLGSIFLLLLLVVGDYQFFCCTV